LALGQGFRGEGVARGINGHAADQGFGEAKFEVKTGGDRLQYFDCHGHNFRANSIPRQQRDPVLRHDCLF